MITQYLVLHADSPGELANSVSKALKEGFQPIGGIAILASLGAIPLFYQAVGK